MGKSSLRVRKSFPRTRRKVKKTGRKRTRKRVSRKHRRTRTRRRRYHMGGADSDSDPFQDFKLRREKELEDMRQLAREVEKTTTDLGSDIGSQTLLDDLVQSSSTDGKTTESESSRLLKQYDRDAQEQYLRNEKQRVLDDCKIFNEKFSNDLNDLFRKFSSTFDEYFKRPVIFEYVDDDDDESGVRASIELLSSSEIKTKLIDEIIHRSNTSLIDKINTKLHETVEVIAKKLKEEKLVEYAKSVLSTEPPQQPPQQSSEEQPKE